MKEHLITFETAKRAKEKGFPQKERRVGEANNHYHMIDGRRITIDDSLDDIVDRGIDVYSPTQDLLHKWLREEHGLHVMPIPTVTAAWTFKTVTVLSKRDDDVIMGIKSVSDLPPYKEVNGSDYRTYEDALEAGLIESLKQIEETNGN